MSRNNIVVDLLTNEIEIKSPSNYEIFVLEAAIEPSPTSSPGSSTTPSPTPTISVSVTPSITPSLSPTPSTSMIVYTSCADYGPHFTTYSTDLVGLLTVNNVALYSGTLGNYQIDWNLNSTSGTTVFKTGNSGNTDPSIQSFHPINSELIQAGTLYPVIRYISINSVLYTPYAGLSGYSYSPDLLTCLPTINVVAMNCSNGYTGSTYPHYISYVNSTQPSSVANRSLTYELNSDGSTETIAWGFTGYQIADRLTIKYMSNSGATETILQDWVIGNDCSTTDYNVTPKLVKRSWQFVDVVHLYEYSGITYQSGDYLVFEILPGYNDPGNTDTNWDLSLKCFTSEEPFSCSVAPNSCQTVDTGATINAVWNSGTCAYNFTITTGEGPSNAGESDLSRYFGASVYYGVDWGTGQTVTIPNNTYGAAYYNDWPYYDPVLLDGSLNITKSGYTLTYTFTNESDYLRYKDGYDSSIADADWVNWTGNSASINHYKWFSEYDRISMSSGDTGTSFYFNIDHESSFDWDDINYVITIDLSPQENGMSPTSECDTTYTDVQNWVDTVNYYWSGNTFSYDTIWGAANPFTFYYMAIVVNGDNYGEWNVFVQLEEYKHPGVCAFEPNWTGEGYVYFYKCRLRIEISDMEDPVNHFRAYTGLNSLGEQTSWQLFQTVG
jgi:hypothetical protein